MRSDGRKPRRLRGAALLGSALAAAGGLLHLPAARPLLGLLGVACPVRRVSAEQVDATRRPALRAMQGGAAAVRRPALGLELDRTRDCDAREWAARRGLACTETARGTRYLFCRDVAAAALGLPAGQGAVHDLALAFDAGGRLVGVDALRRGLTAADAAAMGSAAEDRLTAELGPPSEAAGVWSAGHLAGAMRTCVRRYRFRNYLAFLTATQVPGRGVLLREQYLSGG